MGLEMVSGAVWVMLTSLTTVSGSGLGSELGSGLAVVSATVVGPGRAGIVL